LRGLTSKSDTIHANIQQNGPNWYTCRNMVLQQPRTFFKYTYSLRKKISQKGFGGYFDSHCSVL